MGRCPIGVLCGEDERHACCGLDDVVGRASLRDINEDPNLQIPRRVISGVNLLLSERPTRDVLHGLLLLGYRGSARNCSVKHVVVRVTTGV